MADKELKELSMPKLNDAKHIPTINISMAVLSLSRFVIKISQTASVLNESFLEIFNERTTDEAVSYCLLLAINSPDTDTLEIHANAAMKLLSWVTQLPSIIVSAMNGSILRSFGKVIGKLSSTMAVSHMVANFHRCISIPNDDMINHITNKIKALLYIICWVGNERYHDSSTLDVSMINIWLVNGYNAGIMADVPKADMDEFYIVIAGLLGTHESGCIKMSEWLGLIQKLTNKYKTVIGRYTQMPDFIEMSKILVDAEKSGYIMVSGETYDPKSLWKILKDKVQDKNNHSIQSGTVNIINTYSEPLSDIHINNTAMMNMGIPALPLMGQQPQYGMQPQMQPGMQMNPFMSGMQMQPGMQMNPFMSGMQMQPGMPGMQMQSQMQPGMPGMQMNPLSLIRQPQFPMMGQQPQYGMPGMQMNPFMSGMQMNQQIPGMQMSGYPNQNMAAGGYNPMGQCRFPNTGLFMPMVR